MFVQKTLLLLLPLTQLYASSQTLGDLANNVSSQSTPWDILLTAVPYLIGLSFTVSGVIKLKNHREAPQQVPLSAPIILMTVGSFLIYFPSTVSMVGGTIFGAGSFLNGMNLYYLGQTIDGSTLATLGTT
jgi:hypothetical protein